MPTLTTNFNLGNGTRLIFGKFDLDEETEIATVDIELRTAAAAGDALICQVRSVVKNGVSTVHARATAPSAGLPINAADRYFVATNRTTATGFSAAKTAERAAANNKAARKAALEAHWLSAGHVAASLAYT